jgi:predicted TPR repeat methyltransferase
MVGASGDEHTVCRRGTDNRAPSRAAAALHRPMNATADDRFERARTHFLEGVTHHEAGRLAEAEAAFEASLRWLPGRPSTLMNLGATRLAQGRPEAALEALDASLAASPDQADACCHRARALQALGRQDAALAAYDRALLLEPALPAARFHRASLHLAAARPEAALTDLQPLLDATQPAAAQAFLMAGQAQQALGRHAEALPAYEQARRLAPALPRVHALLGQLLVQLGRAGDARAVWSDAVQRGVEPELNAYLLAGSGTGEAPGRSPDAYVRALFDPYAEGFDEHLVQTLRYRGHEAVVDAARAHRPGTVAAFAHVLDLGCGTGLCGRRIRPHAARVEGIDLSPTMVAAARASGAYDEVHAGELVEVLSRTRREADLVLAADVFIYVGALEALFAVLAPQLRPGALLSFTVETPTADETARHATGWCLRPSLRYAHSADYLRALCARQGWEWLDWQPLVLREEQRQPVHGAVAVLRVSPAP